ncbi:MAG: magnesium transporter [Lachnospiraceae bacterium]|nr:magnesium transporter [Lachnospiraceae bacterium]
MEEDERKENERREFEENVQNLRSLIAIKDQAGISEMIDSRQMIDFAQMVEDLDDGEVRSLLGLMSDDQVASLLEDAEDDERIRIAHQLDNRRLFIAFGFMQKDDIVDMLGDFPFDRRKAVINLMKEEDKEIITKLLNYPEDSAGGLMSTAYIALRADLTVADALEKMRAIGTHTEVIDTIYVTDETRKLIGSVDLRDILTSPRQRPLSAIMDSNVVSVSPETDQEEVARLVSKYDLTAIPVVSATGQIFGIVTVDDVIDVIVEEYDEDMLQMAGVNKEEDLDSTLTESIRMRLPWLLINLATAFLASFVVKLFESTIEQVVALSAIMTIVSGMGGNAGTQTMSIMVRQLAREDIRFRDSFRAFCKELLLGVIDGGACGLVTGVIVTIVYRNVWLGIIVLLAMIGNLVVAGLFGFLVPLILKKLHADPAIASSIFVTTATDVLGFFIFLGLARALMRFLL